MGNNNSTINSPVESSNNNDRIYKSNKNKSERKSNPEYAEERLNSQTNISKKLKNEINDELNNYNEI